MKTAKNGKPLEKPGGLYCNLKSKQCKAYGKVFSDNSGYVCAMCGGRVSKWLPLANALEHDIDE